jgi:hypothetical protein
LAKAVLDSFSGRDADGENWRLKTLDSAERGIAEAKPDTDDISYTHRPLPTDTGDGNFGGDGVG